MLKVLVAVDGSDGALGAVRHALHLTHLGLRAQFVLANVQEPASLYEVVVAHDAQKLEDISAGAAEHALEAAQALMRVAGAAFEVEVAHGDPGHMLLEVCERYGCELIVIGAHGVGGPKRGARAGSVAHAVLNAATVPVTLVREPD